MYPVVAQRLGVRSHSVTFGHRADWCRVADGSNRASQTDYTHDVLDPSSGIFCLHKSHNGLKIKEILYVQQRGLPVSNRLTGRSGAQRINLFSVYSETLFVS